MIAFTGLCASAIAFSTVQVVHGFHRAPCTTNSVRRQFQFSDCYVPNINTNLYLKEASFVMSHDSATGYMNTKNGNGDDSDNGDNSSENSPKYYNSAKSTMTVALLSLYGKTQVGSVYDQLNDGARALDLRPKIYSNGTVGFHHGSLIDIPVASVTLGGLLEHAKKWCKDNPKELVLIFHSELVHEAGYNGLSSQVYMATDDDSSQTDNNSETDDAYAYGYGDDDSNGDDTYKSGYDYFYSGIATLKQEYKQNNVPYYPCSKLSGLTVAETMEMADLSKLGGKGYLLAVDRHDMYASFCGKSNWVEEQIVTCYASSSSTCTDTKNSGAAALSNLKTYVLASSNNEPTDNTYELGPPEDESYYPFNQIQGFWQVDATSVQIGLMHASTLLQDNRMSKVNEEMVKMVYESQFNSVNVFSMDNVALNGNAMFSVLRNQCGQTKVNDDGEEIACGRELALPHMETSRTLPIFWNIVMIVVYSALLLMVSVMLFQAFRLRNKGSQEHRLVCNGHVI